MSDQQVGNIVYQVQMDVQQLLTAQRQLNDRLAEMEDGFNQNADAAENLGSGLSKLAELIKLVVAASALRELASMVQKYQEMAERVQMATSSQAEYESVQKRLLTTANGTYRSLEEAQELYIRTADSLRSMNYTTDQAVDVQDSMSYAFVKNATAADSAEAAISAFSKSVNTGKVAADQWETLTSAIPSVINDIAVASGKSAAEVRALGAAGKLTAKDLTEGLRQSLDANAAAAAGMSNNLIDAGVRTKTAVTQIAVAFENQTGALQAFTSSLITAADGMLSFGQDSKKMSSAIQFGISAATAFALLMGGRFVGSMKQSASAKLDGIMASRQLAAAELQTAKSAEYAATAAVRKAAADKSAALSAVALAQAEYNAARGSAAEAFALDNLTAKKSIAIAISADLVVAENTLAAATARTAVAARAASVAWTLAKGALALIGGPAGAAFIAAGALYYFYQKAEQAKQESIEFADTLGGVISKLNEMGQTQLRGTLGDVAVSIVAQKDKIAELNSEVDRAQKYVNGFAGELEALKGAGAPINLITDAEKRLTSANHELNQKIRDARAASDKLSTTLQQQAIIQKELNRVTDESEKAFSTLKKNLIDTYHLSEAAAEGLASTLTVLKEINAEQSKGPGEISLNVDTSKYDGFILKQKQSLALLQKEGVEREKLKAVQDAINSGALETDKEGNVLESMKAQRAEIEANAEAEFKLQEAEKGRKKAAAGNDKAAAQTESITQKLANLKQQSELAATSTQELSREQAILRAGQSLGAAATEKQVKEAQAYAAATWDAANALKMKQQAEQASKFISQEIAATKTIVDPSTGVAQDPTAQITQEEQQKLAALEVYQKLGVLNLQQYEDGKTAIIQSAAMQRRQIEQDEADRQQQNMSQLLGASSDFFGQMYGLVGDYAGESSAAYKTLFAASKAFSIAQATMNMVMAISNAAALPWPANIPAIAVATAQGANLISQIRGSSYGGARKNGGPVAAGSMYQVGEGGRPELLQSGGKQYMIPGDNGKVISNKDMQGGGNSGLIVYNNIQNYTSATVDSQTRMNSDGSVTIDTIVADLNNGGPVSQAISSNHQAPRRTRE